MNNKLALALLAAQLVALPCRAAPGDLYQTDFGSGSVFRYSPAGAKTTFATGLGSPAGLAFDPKGNPFVANNGGGSIVMITPAGAKTTFAVGLNKPFGLAFDANGNLYEADEGGGVVFKFSPTGTKTTFASGLSAPAGLAFDLSGNLYVSNFTGNRIDKVIPDGTRTTFSTGLSFPNGLTFTPFGNLLECDSGSGNVFFLQRPEQKRYLLTAFSRTPASLWTKQEMRSSPKMLPARLPRSVPPAAKLLSLPACSIHSIWLLSHPAQRSPASPRASLFLPATRY